MRSLKVSYRQSVELRLPDGRSKWIGLEVESAQEFEQGDEQALIDAMARSLKEQVEGLLAEWSEAEAPPPPEASPVGGPATDGAQATLDKAGRWPGKVEEYDVYYISYEGLTAKGARRYAFWPQINGLPGRWPSTPKVTLAQSVWEILSPHIDEERIETLTNEGEPCPLDRPLRLTFKVVADKGGGIPQTGYYWRNLVGATALGE